MALIEQIQMKECHYLGLCRDESPPLFALVRVHLDLSEIFKSDFYFKVKCFLEKRGGCNKYRLPAARHIKQQSNVHVKLKLEDTQTHSHTDTNMNAQDLH